MPRKQVRIGISAMEKARRQLLKLDERAFGHAVATRS
jgi:hypothetical protein